MRDLHWSTAVNTCHSRGEAYVLATVMGVAGSTPREPGSKMVITAKTIYDTIGGGQLEFEVILKARKLLLKTEAQQSIEAFPLAATGQCCGGSVSVLLEFMPACSWHIVVYGAGHVAQKLIAILGGLPCQLTWIDSRAELFPEVLPANTRCINTGDLVATVGTLPVNAEVLVLTHDHVLDYALCDAALRRNLHVGLIGSATKAKRFYKRLENSGYSPEQLAYLRCPVGLSEVPGKLPTEVAVSISAELIQRHHSTSAKQETRRGLSWRQIRDVLEEKGKLSA